MLNSYSLQPFILVLLFISLCHSCNSKDPLRLNSNDLDAPAERVNLLKTVTNAPTEFSDADFELFNANGFSKNAQSRSIPAPSTWYYGFIVKVQKSDIPKWTVGLNQLDSDAIAPAWVEELRNKRKGHWQTKGKAARYSFEATGMEISVLVYPDEGIVCKRILQN